MCVCVCVCVWVKITDRPLDPLPNLAGHMQPADHELYIFSVNVITRTYHISIRTLQIHSLILW